MVKFYVFAHHTQSSSTFKHLDVTITAKWTGDEEIEADMTDEKQVKTIDAVIARKEPGWRTTHPSSSLDSPIQGGRIPRGAAPPSPSPTPEEEIGFLFTKQQNARPRASIDIPQPLTASEVKLIDHIMNERVKEAKCVVKTNTYITWRKQAKATVLHERDAFRERIVRESFVVTPPLSEYELAQVISRADHLGVWEPIGYADLRKLHVVIVKMVNERRASKYKHSATERMAKQAPLVDNLEWSSSLRATLTRAVSRRNLTDSEVARIVLVAKSLATKKTTYVNTDILANAIGIVLRER